MSNIWMSHATRMNESCHTYKWVMAHKWMSHSTRMNVSWHICERFLAHIWKHACVSVSRTCPCLSLTLCPCLCLCMSLCLFLCVYMSVCKYNHIYIYICTLKYAHTHTAWQAKKSKKKCFFFKKRGAMSYCSTCNNRVQMCPQLSAIDVTEKTFFERLYLVLGLGTFGTWVNCPYASTTPPIHCTTISRYLCNFFPWMAPQFFWSTIHQVIWPSPGNPHGVHSFHRLHRMCCWYFTLYVYAHAHYTYTYTYIYTYTHTRYTYTHTECVLVLHVVPMLYMHTTYAQSHYTCTYTECVLALHLYAYNMQCKNWFHA